MKYTIEINDNTSTGRSLLTVVRSMKKNVPDINIYSEKELEDMIDFGIGKAIEKKRTGKLVNRERIMELLDK